MMLLAREAEERQLARVPPEVGELVSALRDLSTLDVTVDAGFVPDVVTDECSDDGEIAPVWVSYSREGVHWSDALCVECAVTDVAYAARYGVMPDDGIVSVEVRLTPAQAAVVVTDQVVAA